MKLPFTLKEKLMLKLVLSITFVLTMGIQSLLAQDHAFEWAYGLGGNFNAQDRAGTIYTDIDNNVYVTGSILGPADFDPSPTDTTSLGTAFFDAFISKMDAAGDLVWAKTFGGTNADVGNGISADNNGNVYVTGQFYNSGDFDPGTGTVNLSSNGQFDMFICKFDINGDLEWAKSIGGSLFDRGTAIVADDAGNVYVTGSFWGTVDFDPGAGTTNLTSTANQDLFLMKLDVNGNLLWANNFGALGNNEGSSLKLDSDGNILLSGFFSGATDFNPGAGSAILNGNANGSQDGFVAKYDEDGNYLWAEKISSSGIDQAVSLSLDTADNVYIAGTFETTATLEQGAGTVDLVSNGDRDIFVAKFNKDGELTWAKSMGNNGDDRGEGISVDVYGNCFVTGRFAGTVDIDPGLGSTQLVSNGAFYDAFIAKLDANGNFVWGKSVGSSSTDNGTGIAVDYFNNVYVTGSYSDTVDFDPGVGISEVASKGSEDIFVLKLSCVPSVFTLSIDACDAYTFNGVTYTTNNNTATDTLVNSHGCDSIVTLDLSIILIDASTNANGDTIRANAFGASYQWINCLDNSIIAGATEQEFMATETGDYAVVVSENGCTDTSDCVSVTVVNVGVKDSYQNNMSIYPNPTSGVVIISELQLNSDEVIIFDVSGKEVFRILPSSTSIDLSLLDEGVYFLEIQRSNEILRGKLIKK